MRVGVVGCGLMGAGIAEVSARAGADVVVVETDEMAAKAGSARLERSIAAAVAKGKLTAAAGDEALGRVRVGFDFDALADRQLVIEAVPEVEPMKVAIFRKLDAIVVAPDAVLASNTSSIPIMRLAMATGRPEWVLGLHFFNPVAVLPLVELVGSLVTTQAATSVATGFVEQHLGKHLIHSRDRAGFIVNALLIPYVLSAIRMLESGFASAQDIDTGMVHGCAHPMGPLALADLIGLDTTMFVADSLYEEFKEPLYAPPPLLARMVEGGMLGRKSGRGFHVYAH